MPRLIKRIIFALCAVPLAVAIPAWWMLVWVFTGRDPITEDTWWDQLLAWTKK